MSQAEVLSHTVTSSDTWTTIATALASAINADTTLSNLGVTATSSGAMVTLSSTSSDQTTYTESVSGNGKTLTLNGSSSANGNLSTSQNFTANPILAPGLNIASVTAVSGGGTSTTNTFPITVNSAAYSKFHF